jgi:hypothetical protein
VASAEAAGEALASVSPPSLADATAIPDAEKIAASSVPSSAATKVARLREAWCTAVPPPEGPPVLGAFKDSTGR